MLFRFCRQGTAKERIERHSGPKGCAQINLVVAKEAGAEPAVGGKPHAIAAPTIRVRHRRNHTDRADGAGESVITCGSVAPHRSFGGLEMADVFQTGENL